MLILGCHSFRKANKIIIIDKRKKNYNNVYKPWLYILMEK